MLTTVFGLGPDGAGRPFMWRLFAAALALRWAYVLGIYATIGPGGLLSPDSSFYLAGAGSLAGSASGFDWFGPETQAMPLYFWFLRPAAAAGEAVAPLVAALMQGLVDAGSVVLVALLAAAMDRRLAVAAGLFAALNPTQIVLAGLVLTDSLFLFFAAAALLAACRWLAAPGWRPALLLGAALGAATLTRAMMLPWLGAAPVLLALLALGRHRLDARRLGQLAAGAALAALLLTPVLARNWARYDSLQLTSQAGAHFLFWVVPLVMEADDGTVPAAGAARMRSRFAARDEATELTDPFALSAAQTGFAFKALKELGAGAVARAWAVGAALNLGAPALVLAPPVARLPRVGFYATAGATPFEKAWSFLFANRSPLYAWLVVAGGLGVLVLRLVQLRGLAAGVRLGGTGTASIVFLAAWCLFVLVVAGPVASPKYRLPMEPAFAVFFALGYQALRRRPGPATSP